MYINGYDEWKTRSDQTVNSRDKEQPTYKTECIINGTHALLDITINEDEELFYCGKVTLSFDEAIKIQDQLDNIDWTNTGFKPWYIPVFGMFISKDEFTTMYEYFDINKANLNEL